MSPGTSRPIARSWDATREPFFFDDRKISSSGEMTCVLKIRDEGASSCSTRRESSFARRAERRDTRSRSAAVRLELPQETGRAVPFSLDSCWGSTGGGFSVVEDVVSSEVMVES